MVFAKFTAIPLTVSLYHYKLNYVVGEELCYQLSRLGARLILTARSEDKLKVVMKGLAKPNQAKYVRYNYNYRLKCRGGTTTVHLISTVYIDHVTILLI